MSGSRQDVRTSSVRVALGATAVVAALYLLVAAGVFVVVTNALTAQLDGQLTDSLRRISSQPDNPPPGGFDAPRPDRPFGPTLLVWTVLADGTVQANTSGADLPAAYAGVTTPVTVTIGGTDVRITGGAAGSRHVVVGQRTLEVASTQGTLLQAELIIGPVLLALVFLGAVAIGRRVAAPIERARQRQLEFSADASHELRTPMSVIEAQTSLALSGEREPEADRNAFERIDRESRRVRRILDDLMWLARFDALRGAPPDAEPVDLAVMAEATADRFAVVAEARRLDLAVSAAPGSHVVAIPPEWLDRFHRASAQGGGAGLGLAIADGIVRATHGRWRVGASALGGASLSVSWPRALDDGRQAAS